ncbi:uncharacterized protein Proc [Hetaerina americana]|uniref:uncharacterized protein Proc n=1 Tax=Hetaerina americana TaxID=62018 RepID=UPI003A7F39B9
MRGAVSYSELVSNVCPLTPSALHDRAHTIQTSSSALTTSQRSPKTTARALASSNTRALTLQKVKRMSPLSLMKHALLAALVVIALSNWGVEARYLPTRSQDDRLERLRELIKDLLDTELEKPGNQNELFERKLVYKREAGAVDGPASAVAVAAGEHHVAPSHPRSQ